MSGRGRACKNSGLVALSVWDVCTDRLSQCWCHCNFFPDPEALVLKRFGHFIFDNLVCPKLKAGIVLNVLLTCPTH